MLGYCVGRRIRRYSCKSIHLQKNWYSFLSQIDIYMHYKIASLAYFNNFPVACPGKRNSLLWQGTSKPKSILTSLYAYVSYLQVCSLMCFASLFWQCATLFENPGGSRYVFPGGGGVDININRFEPMFPVVGWFAFKRQTGDTYIKIIYLWAHVLPNAWNCTARNGIINFGHWYHLRNLNNFDFLHD